MVDWEGLWEVDSIAKMGEKGGSFLPPFLWAISRVVFLRGG